MRLRTTRCAGIASLALCAAFAQSPSPSPAFDVASIKPHPPMSCGTADFRIEPGGRRIVTGLTVNVILRRLFS
jgi:hypothetical protein